MRWDDANRRRLALVEANRAFDHELPPDISSPERNPVRVPTEDSSAPTVKAEPCALAVYPPRVGRDLLYPERTRCVTCRKVLDGEILDLLFCSRECGGYGPEPFFRYAPRQCVVPKTPKNERKWKVRYVHPTLADRNRAKGQNVYHCFFCHTWHLGTLGIDKPVRVPKPGVMRPRSPVSGPAVIVGLVKNAEGEWVRER